jgi:hypothetical protein
MKMNSALKQFTAIVAILAFLAVGGIGLVNRSVQAQSSGTFASVFPNKVFPAMVFTATSQTKKQTISSGIGGGGGCGLATISINGTALTTVTWQVKASNDNGVSYFAIPYSDGTFTSNVQTKVTGAAVTNTAAALYWVSLSGMTHFEIITSGTFTATNVTAQVTCSSNPSGF